jgi:sugar lactone lactonase YvrE
MKKENGSSTFRLFGFVSTIMLCLGTWAVADGPVADFPSFIGFTTTAKTGDVAVDKMGNVYVNVTERQDGHVRIWQFSPAGEKTVVADIAPGVAYGLALDANGDLYSAIVGPFQGVYKVGKDGTPVRLPGTERIASANAMAFDPRGNLYVTESSSPDGGGVWRIPPWGEAELLIRDELLTGTGATFGSPVGANGIAFFHGDLYVANTDKCMIVRIPVHPDGSLGNADIWATLGEVPESLLKGTSYPVAPDGITLDVHGNVYIAVVTRLAVVKINAEDCSQETVAALSFDPAKPFWAPLDTPNSVAFGTGKGGKQTIFATNLGLMSRLLPGPAWPGAGLMKIEAEDPGLALR